MNAPHVSRRRIETLRRKLRKRADYIDKKFKRNRQFDINDEYVKQILKDISELQELSPGLNVQVIRTIQDICASAISLYLEPANRPYFFEHLRRIIPLLKEI